MFIPDNQPAPSYAPQTGASGFEDEPPLLEELGINPDHILQKTLTVLNPMRSTDVSGRSFFQYHLTAFSGFHSWRQWPCWPHSFRYGFWVLYHVLWEALLQLHLWDRVDGLPRYVLSTEPNVPLRSFYRVVHGYENISNPNPIISRCVVSVLGYCLLPIVGLSGLSILFSLSGVLGNILTGMAVAWCTLSSSKVFTTYWLI